MVGCTSSRQITRGLPGWSADGSELSATATRVHAQPASMRNLLAASAMDEPILISYGSESELFSDSQTVDG